MLTTLTRFDVYSKTAAGLYDHIRLFQTGWRYFGPRNSSSWILPAVCEPTRNAPCPNNTEENSGISPAYRKWILPRGNAGMDDDADTDGFPNRFSSTCWYFGQALSDARAADSAAGVDPIPIGLVASSVGGTDIQHWLPPWATGNATCSDNNCGWVEQLPPDNPVQPSTTETCQNSSLATVYSCRSGVCSTLWHSMIAPFVNMSIMSIIWYQGAAPPHSSLYRGRRRAPPFQLALVFVCVPRPPASPQYHPTHNARLCVPTRPHSKRFSLTVQGKTIRFFLAATPRQATSASKMH